MTSQSGMYRTPRDPGGFPFGYNWRATGTGLFLLVAFNFLATQFIAAQFRYQSALGTPIMRMSRVALYQPFAWCIWGFQNCTSRDSRITKPLFEGEMIVLGGCILSMVAFFIAANRRAQRLSENAEDLHGSARLAAPEDIEATGIMRSQGGVYVGGWYNDATRRLQYLRHNGPEHVLAFAPTRSGKGVGLVIPTLLAWDESAVIYDIKGENWAKTAGYRASRGQLCFKFSPVGGHFIPFQPAGRGSFVYAARCLRRAEHCRHDHSERRGQPDGAPLGRQCGVAHDRHDPARLLHGSC